ncbi:hypothetical protein G7K_2967-t1 [Saitoella complicata NRRL Y-17804]|uniref:Succinate/fumarate mitochondrial transporter n=1 Tax=Saitoella complicata (strain BCRC 22490 / CBS 7301 / JCM 7358 / NBRC 10748 / NRRL Y-17804) TaxID=698492 RepID=A0A0E9NG54_SAICN|nr:hypothetical protein G7K_2967-t1 [Saitoella complicata NRRL Y-17804]
MLRSTHTPRSIVPINNNYDDDDDDYLNMPRGNDTKERTPMSVHLIAGGTAGFMEAMCCHPLDTIKVRMQLSRSGQSGEKARGFIKTGALIIRKETPLGLYKGLGAVITGIVPKMAIRFSSFEYYKTVLASKETGQVSTTGTFFAGLFAGVTEAVAVVTPMEVVKIRLQAQSHSLSDPLDVPKYRNAAHAAYTIVSEEGVGALYKGVALTALRQATNQAVNFTAYQELKKLCVKYQPQYADTELPSYQHLLLGLVSGAMGPLSNAPIDTIKTRIQRASNPRGESGWSRFMTVAKDLVKHEGIHALYKGITPRIMRVAPGQAVTFAVYEKVKGMLDLFKEKSLKEVLFEE